MCTDGMIKEFGIVTEDFGNFGKRERLMAEKLLHAWNTDGLPVDFDTTNVRFAFNTVSGNVFLTNDEWEVAMMNGDNLEMWYVTPYNGDEGFLQDLLNELHPEDLHSEDELFIAELVNERDMNHAELSDAWQLVMAERFPI